MLLDYVKRWINESAQKDSRFARLLLDFLGYGGHWIRRVMNDDIKRYLHKLPVEMLSAGEISGHHFAYLPWHSYKALMYPQFDICATEILQVGSFDVVFCEQVLEHVWEPQKALKNLYKMLRPNGYLVVSTPFMVKVHKCPEDYWRFTPDCLHRMLTESGFEVESLNDWGNLNCVKANLLKKKWARYHPLRSLKKSNDIPVTVWAIARKSNTTL